MKVRIYQPGKTAMQSGRFKTERWVLEYETETPRRPESLMGWTSSGDTLNQVQMRFDSKSAAIGFAESKGWEYSVGETYTRQVQPRNYIDNFKYRPPEEA